MPESEPSPSPPRPELKLKRPAPEVPEAIRSRGSRSTDSRTRRSDSPGGVGSAFFRLLLWIATAGWLLFLAFKLLDPLPFLFPNEDDPSAYAWWRVKREALEPRSGPSTADAAGEQDSPELYALKLKVVDAMLDGALPEALDLVGRQQEAPDIYPYQEALEELSGFVRAVSQVNATVADAIRDRIDEEVVIRVKNRRLTIVPRASAGDRVNAVLVPSRTDQRRRSVTFSVSDIDPIERAHWIGQADTACKCAMKLLLHMNAGDCEGARVFAPSCGILAKAFEAHLETSAPRGPVEP